MPHIFQVVATESNGKNSSICVRNAEANNQRSCKLMNRMLTVGMAIRMIIKLKQFALQNCCLNKLLCVIIFDENEVKMR